MRRWWIAMAITIPLVGFGTWYFLPWL